MIGKMDTIMITKPLSSSLSSLSSLSSRGKHLELRQKIRGYQLVKDSEDYVTSINDYREDLQYCKSVKDIVDCGKVPLLLPSINTIQEYTLKNNDTTNYNRLNDDSMHEKSLTRNMGILTNSTIIKSLNALPRMISDKHNPITKPFNVHKSDDVTIEKYRRATSIKKYASTVVDPGRIMFEAALLYDEINQVKHAIKCFTEATKIIDSSVVVDTYDLPITDNYYRKLERMNRQHRSDFLARKALLREQLIFAEDERQRLRSIVSNSQLVRLHLHISNYVQAQHCIKEALCRTTSTVERSEILWYLHSILKNHMSSAYNREIPIDQQILLHSAGIIGESHIAILKEILEENSVSVEIYECLGLRYAEKCDFNQSLHYYVRGRNIKDNDEYLQDSYNSQRQEQLAEGGGVGDNAAIVASWHKSIRAEYQSDVVQVPPQNYAYFTGKHTHTDVHIYNIPPQGWDSRE